MNSAAQIVSLMLEGPVLRVCAFCEKEHQAAGKGPIPVEPGFEKSHGICAKHYPQYLRDMEFPPEEIASMMASMAPEDYSPSYPPVTG